MTKPLPSGTRRLLAALFQIGATAGVTDHQLLERFNTGNREAAEWAFAALVERHGPMVLNVCRSALRDEHEACDAFQAAFLVLLRRAGTLHITDSLGPWLYQVSCRVARRARSASGRRQFHEQQAAAQAKTQAYEQMSECDLGPVLHEEIERLPERYRAPVLLCCLEGFTQGQAARRLGWPLGTVQSRLARGRARLRDRLTRRGLAPALLLAATPLATANAAAVPKALADSVVRAAVQVYLKKTPIAGAVSAAAVRLAEGVAGTMLSTKLKLAVAALMLASIGATGAAVWAGQGRGSSNPLGATTQPDQQVVPDPAVVARVNGVPITRDQLIERCLARYGAKELETSTLR